MFAVSTHVLAKYKKANELKKDIKLLTSEGYSTSDEETYQRNDFLNDDSTQQLSISVRNCFNLMALY